MTTTFSRCAPRFTLAIVLLLSGCEPAAEVFHAGGFSYSTERFEQWKLPRSLREISGLAETVDGRLFALSDERAIVHQIDYHGGKRLKAFSLNNRPGSKVKNGVRGDFEGIAVVGNVVYLITSQGTIYTSRLGVDGTAVPFQFFDTGLADVCEIEGLSYHPDHHVLLLACKAARRADLRGQVVVFQWSIDEQSLIPDATISFSIAAVTRNLPGQDNFNPSGICVSPRTGNLLMVAARQQAMLEATMSGEIVNVFSLPLERYHRQTEGIAMFADGTLILADEGGKKRGRLGVYRAID